MLWRQHRKIPPAEYPIVLMCAGSTWYLSALAATQPSAHLTSPISSCQRTGGAHRYSTSNTSNLVRLTKGSLRTGCCFVSCAAVYVDDGRMQIAGTGFAAATRPAPASCRQAPYRNDCPSCGLPMLGCRVGYSQLSDNDTFSSRANPPQACSVKMPILRPASPPGRMHCSQEDSRRGASDPRPVAKSVTANRCSGKKERGRRACAGPSQLTGF